MPVEVAEPAPAPLLAVKPEGPTGVRSVPKGLWIGIGIAGGLAIAGIATGAMTLSESSALRGQTDIARADFDSAQARVRIQEQLEGLSVDAEVKALDNVRTHIKNQISQANLNKELGEADLDGRLKKLRAGSGDVTAKSQLAELKAAAAAKKAATLKSM